ncbi:MAG: hypothetical protein QNJ97_17525 [Myxococcota bacterium]|nr:hypothetical protein [Myxococcota bacterium]
MKRYPMFVLSALFICACGQDSVDWPDQGESSGECGDWYPPFDDQDSDQDSDNDSDDGNDTDSEDEDIYGFKKGDILPCLVWKSAYLNGDDTYVNIGDEYLETQYSPSDKKAILIVVSAEE